MIFELENQGNKKQPNKVQKSIWRRIDKVIFFWVDPKKYKLQMIILLSLSYLTNISLLLIVILHLKNR